MMNKIIDKAKYEGYIWKSDQAVPEVYDGSKEVFVTLCDADNPFIIEGNLWDAEQRCSISIRYVDGQYYVNETLVTEEELKGIDDRNLDIHADSQVATTIKEYVPHRMGNGISALRFLQYWKAETDPMCEGMPTLRLYKLVFIGFKRDSGRTTL